MMDRARRYRSQVILILSCALAIALAERLLTYLVITALACVLGWVFTVRRDRPLMSQNLSRAFVVVSFLFLVYEYFYMAEIPILALSHFMLLVCSCKLLERRTLRDDAQILILALLLLVVTSIVSGNVLYMIVLAVFMTVGVDALMRWYLGSQQQSSARRLIGIDPRLGPPPEGEALRTDRLILGGPILAMLIISITIGVVIFVVVPRTSAGMLNQLQSSASSVGVTGFADQLDLNRGGRIQTSNQPMMRVQIEYDASRPNANAPREDLYFRGMVLHHYVRNPHSGHRGWGWRRVEMEAGRSRQYAIEPPGPFEGGSAIIELDESASTGPITIQHYWLEPSGERYLFALYPALEMSSKDIDQIEKTRGDQVIYCLWKPTAQLHYVMRSAETASPDVLHALTLDRGRALGDRPRVYRPQPPLPREGEIRELIRDEVGTLENPDDPEEAEAFAEAVERFLRSSRFTYTLENPTIARGLEPVGEFLLDRRSGHCEYSASAMAVICQLHGLPARVVNGYRGGDYNAVGDFYVVKRKHAHSWVEVHIPGRDWIRYDPTPASEFDTSVASAWWNELNSYIDFVQFHWATFVVSYDTSLRSTLFESLRAWLSRPAHDEKTFTGAIWSFIRELFGWRLKLSPSERLIYWAFALLVLALAILVTYVLVVCAWWSISRLLRWWRGHASGTPPELEFYDRYLRLLDQLGLNRPPSQTPAEFARELATVHPHLSDTPHLVRSYYEIVYGGHALPGPRRDRVRAQLRRIGELKPKDLQPSSETPEAHGPVRSSESASGA